MSERKHRRAPTLCCPSLDHVPVLLGRGLGGTAAVARTLSDMIGPAPSWVWAASLFLLLALVGALVLAALRICWPTQSVHRKQLLESLLSRRSTP